ncbi:MAG: autotransporter domain-containing protein [Hyphomicrobiales bacterium]
MDLLRTTALPVVLLGGLSLALAFSSSAQAADAFWDGTSGNTNDGNIDGGAGTWNSSNTNWTNATDSAPGVIWVSGDTAVFAGAAGTVTVSGAQQISGLTFNTAGYTISGDALDINGAAAVLSASGSVTISSAIIDSGGGGTVTISTGTISLSGSNTFAGGTSVSNGASLNLSGSLAGSLTNAGTTVISAGGFTSGALIQNSGTSTIDGQVASLDVNGGSTTNNATVAGVATTSAILINNGTLSGAVTAESGGTLTSTATLSSGLSVNLAGTANISGTANGAINNSGQLNFSGTTSGNNAITNNSLGTMTAVGTMALNGFTSFSNAGTFDLLDGDVGEQVTIATNFTNTGTLEIDIASNGTSDKLMVTGTVSLAGSLNVSAVDAEAAFQAAASGSGGQIEYVIIENDAADAVTGSFAGVTDDLAFFSSDISTTGGDGNDVLLTLTAQTVDFEPVATNDNQSGAADALDNFDYSSTEGQGILAAFQALTNEEAAQALEQMTGGGHVGAASKAGATSSAFANTVLANAAQAGGFGGNPTGGTGTEQASAYSETPADDERFDVFEKVATSKISARERATGYALWTQIAGGYSSVDADQNANELESYSGGVFVGTEFVRIEGAFDAIIGGSLGYSYTVFDNNTSGYDAKADSFHAGLYGGIGAVGIDQVGFGLTAALSYSHHQYETERHIIVGNVTAEGEYSGYTIGGQVRARYGHEVSVASSDLIISPVLGFDLFANETDSFLETGAGLLNLEGAGVSTTSAKSVIGASVSNAFQFGTVAVAGGITATWEHQFADTSGSQTMAFAGSPTSFQTISAEEARDVFALGTSTSFELTDRAQLNLSGRSTLSETSRSAESRLQLKMQL